MPQVTFKPSNITVSATAGAELVDSARRAGITIETPCGAKGACGKCVVRIASGVVDTDSLGKLSQQHIDDGYVLACRTNISDSDIVVELAHHERDDGQFADNIEGIRALNPDVMPHEDERAALTTKYACMVAQAQLEDGLADVDRLMQAIGATTGAKNVHCPLAVIQNLGDILRAGNGAVTVTAASSETRHTVVKVESGNTAARHYGIAVDVGTTTIAVVLVSLADSSVLAVHADYNAQLSCGLDVIGRINYAKRGDGLEDLRMRVLETINGLTAKCADSAGIAADEITSAALSGNTTMTHLLLGINPEYIRLEPYTPTLLNVPVFAAQDFGLNICPSAPAAFSPAVGSYVGGDITAGVLCTSLAGDSEEICLFMDIGTNGELVAGNRDFLMSCACSAGPAFEGGGIDCGMRAAEGAIERVEIDAQTGGAGISTIGNGKPRGICGTGMISLLAGLVRTGWLDRAGKLSRDKQSPSIRIDGRKAFYILAEESESGSGAAIEISEHDIENILRAKAAVYSACALMMNQIGISFDDCAKVYIAGGFGRFIELENAVTLGLLPDIDRSKFHFIGNASLTGTYMTLISRKHRALQAALAKRMTYLELNTDPAYMDQYTGALFIPHTDAGLFPSVQIAS